jgi:hypothetical protein
MIAIAGAARPRPGDPEPGPEPGRRRWLAVRRLRGDEAEADEGDLPAPEDRPRARAR